MILSTWLKLSLVDSLIMSKYYILRILAVQAEIAKNRLSFALLKCQGFFYLVLILYKIRQPTFPAYSDDQRAVLLHGSCTQGTVW